MKPPPFAYLRPTTLDEVTAALEVHGPEAKLLAGGQSLIPLLNFRLARPAVLIDLGRVDGLAGVGSEGGVLRIGAMTRQRSLEREADAAAACPLLRAAIGHVGHTQTRNLGTVGGSIAHGDAAAELPAVMLALGATMTVASVRGTRDVDADAFFLGPFTTAIEPDEALVEIAVPLPAGRRAAFVELARRPGDFAIAGIAAVADPTGDGTDRVRLAGLGIGWTPVRLPDAEAVASGGPLDAARIEAAADAAAAEIDPPDDIHADATYRREATAVLVRRALAALVAADRATGRTA